jgi:hypothetical protein
LILASAALIEGYLRDMTFAGIKRRLPWLRHGDGAEAVPFRFEHPIWIVERLVGQRDKHWAQIELHRDQLEPAASD